MAKMDVSFYINTSPTIKVSKTLGDAVKIVSVDIPDNVDVVNPVLIIDDSNNEGILSSEVNYMECGAPLSRKYFITAMDYTNAKRVIVAGHVDVLSTYSSLLENTTLNYVRGAGSPTEMDDVSYPISDYMIEQYFPMETWDDIFSADGDGRQYLLRTVCSDTETPNYVDLTNGNVFWDSGAVYYDEVNADPQTGDPRMYYRCYRFDSAWNRNYTPMYVPRQDITGLSQVSDGDYVRSDGRIWQWQAGNHTPGSTNGPLFIYKGATT